MRDRQLFQRLGVVHRPDCSLFADGPLPQPAPDPDVLAQVLGTEEAALYAKACHPVFEDLRRIVGQIAGLMILAQLTQSSEVADLEELSSCQRRWKDCADRLRALRAPSALAGHFEQLSATHAGCGRALSEFQLLRASGDNEAIFDRIAAQVSRAYAHLSAATSQKAGLEMVDLTHACCSCGR
ncbi:hypothetical protein ACFPLB_11910 [Aquamicrobium segne]|uniref:Uncharacterized protein n=1 Tax=Aquamicrobium segne TaxID=469547 RepID=A0ABW0GZM6_9HYPH